MTSENNMYHDRPKRKGTAHLADTRPILDESRRRDAWNQYCDIRRLAEMGWAASFAVAGIHPEDRAKEVYEAAEAMHAENERRRPVA
jgi:hypothetical protein